MSYDHQYLYLSSKYNSRFDTSTKEQGLVIVVETTQGIYLSHLLKLEALSYISSKFVLYISIFNIIIYKYAIELYIEGTVEIAWCITIVYLFTLRHYDY